MKTHNQTLKFGGSGLVEAVRFAWSETDQFVRRRLALIVLCVLLSSALAVLAPIALKLLIDSLASRSMPTTALPLTLVGAYVLSQLLTRVIGEVRTLVHAQADRRLYRMLSNRFLSHVLRLPLRYHLQRQTGAVSGILSNGLTGYQMVLQSTVFTLLPVLVELSAVAVVLLQLQQKGLMVLFFVALAAYATAFTLGVKRTQDLARSASTIQIEASAVLTDSVLNYEIVKYFTAEALIWNRFNNILTRSESAWLRFFKYRTLTAMMVAIIFVVFIAITMLYAVHEVQGGGMTIGDFVLVNTYMFQLARPVEMVGVAIQQISQGVVFIEKINHLLHDAPEVGDEAVADALTRAGAGKLEFRQVSAGYDDGQSVLKDISFVVPAGNTLGIVGASGSGKSTIARLLMRMMDTDVGHILLDDNLVTQINLGTLRRAIAIVPQDTVLFDDTIANNIALGRESASRTEIEHAAKLARLHEFVMKLPQGYDTRVGERGAKLSGGEKQRLSIARAALKQPRIFVFDEATSSLDSETERDIMHNLHEISGKCTTVLIAHRLSTVVHADEILVLHDGAIIERGAHTELLAAGGRYAALWRAQSEKSGALDTYCRSSCG